MEGEEGGRGAAVAKSGDGVAEGALAMVGVELECDAAAGGGFDAVGRVFVCGGEGGKCSSGGRGVKRMPVFVLLHALVLQRGNAHLLFRYAQFDYGLGFAISSFESSTVRFEPL